MNIEELKGEEILIQSDFNLPTSDKFYFSNAIINLNNKSFVSKDPEIKIHKNIFDNSENDPRIKRSQLRAIQKKQSSIRQVLQVVKIIKIVLRGQ